MAFIRVATYNVEHEWYKRVNALLNGKKYEGFKWEYSFVYKINK